MTTLGDVKTGPSGLAYVDREVESAFRKDYFEKGLPHFRVSLLLGAFLYGIFGLLDGKLLPEARQTAWTIRYLFVCPIVLGLFLLSFSRHFRRLMEPASFVVAFSAGAGIVATIALAPSRFGNHYFPGLFVCIMFCYTLLRLRFATASVLSWTVAALYVATAFGVTDVPDTVLVNNASYLVALNVIGMWVAYSIERSLRSDFVQRQVIREQGDALGRALVDVEVRRRIAEEMSRTDPLTGLANRRDFRFVAEHEMGRRGRHGQPISALMLDIDHFKKVNDTFGHAAGDLVLKAVAGRILNGVRQIDSPCRYGGEEFVVLLPETGEPLAARVAARLRESVESTIVETDAGPISVTVSVGIATLSDSDPADLDALLGRADQALYEAKQGGRNRVRVWNREGRRGNAAAGPQLASVTPFGRSGAKRRRRR